MSEPGKFEPVTVRPDLRTKIEQRIPATEFDHVDEYVNHILAEVLDCVEDENELSDIDPVDEKEVESRLESLGYLNDR
jgi:hypothetical protein